MSSKRNIRSGQQRTLIAQTAARFMAEHGIRDFYLAKNKALESMGITRNTPNMPRNVEVEEALAEHQRLFQADSQPLALARLRRVAAEALVFMADFQPRLVGPVLSGVAGADSVVNLHLFADTPEDVLVFLLDHGIPHDTEQRRLRFSDSGAQDYPMYRFDADGVTVELTIFGRNGLRQAPLSPVDGRPMRRAELAEVRALLQLESADTMVAQPTSVPR